MSSQPAAKLLSRIAPPKTAPELVDRVDLLRLDATRQLDPTRRKELGQFLTSASIARMMAAMFKLESHTVRLLDPGAGVGSLTAALVERICNRESAARTVRVVAYEVDDLLGEYLRETLDLCGRACERAGIEFAAVVRTDDFVISVAEQLSLGPLFASDDVVFNTVIMNPPYRKIRNSSEERAFLDLVGVDTGNLYTAFLALATRLLRTSGELVAITPRSFCNGPYFLPFREQFLAAMEFTNIHVFHSRSKPFGADDVLQENIVFRALRSDDMLEDEVVVTTSDGPDDDAPTQWKLARTELVHAEDPNQFIRLVTDGIQTQVVKWMDRFDHQLQDLDIQVSTGRVVDFRARAFLRDEPTNETVPLVYPGHLNHGFVEWPRPGCKKPNALLVNPQTLELVVPNEPYVLVKRFSSKEERRRIVAAVYDPRKVDADTVGFENHLNYFHRGGSGLPFGLAKGLAAFLNSTLVDMFFRQFSGHTQVNATDLRSLRYPPIKDLESLGARIGDGFPGQAELDALIETELVYMADGGLDPVRAKHKIDEALRLLLDLGLPRAQRNERSALSLLALLDLAPPTPWVDASNPLRGITPMMDFFRDQYGKNYAPNTRETVRRQTIHQFEQAGIVKANPDDPSRPTNSPGYVYQIQEQVLELARTVGKPGYDEALREFLASVETLRRRYSQAREVERIPVRIRADKTVELSPGGQNVLVKQVVEEFCSRFTRGELVHVGDTAEKWAYLDREVLDKLGVTIEEHGKMPDVVVYMEDRNWLVLIEAVTSHGPVNPKRRLELQELFAESSAGLVYVTAFLDRRTLNRFLSDIAWETEVWVADAPGHLIHFNGERFLGPRD